MATLGDDGAPYRERLASLGIAIDGVRTLPQTFTAQAFIITDLDDNQITAFHPGAMNASHENRVGDVAGHRARHRRARRQGGHALARRAVRAGGDSRSCSIRARACRCSPGPELIAMIDAASFVAVNDYEGAAAGRAHGPVARRDRASASRR